MRWLFLLISMVLVTGCGRMFSPTVEERAAEAKQKAADVIRCKVAVELRNKKDLRLCGFGSQMMGQIKMLALSFNYYKPVELEEARDLLIFAVDEFVSAINADEQIRPYLDNYPFTSKNIEIRIFIQNPDGSRIAPGALSIISAKEGVLAYDIDGKPLCKTIHQETYETAVLEINRASKKSA